MENHHPFTKFPSLKNYRVFYQPIVDASAKKISKLEALLRPSSFKQMPVPQLIKLLERIRTIDKLDAYVRGEALSQLALFHTIDPTLGMSVNLSPRSLVPGLAREVETQLAAAKIDPEFLTLEITESRAIVDLTSTKKCIRDLQALGCKVYLDDFCTRFSTLNHLAELQVDGLKIDRSYVWLTDRLGYERYLIDSLARIGHGFNLEMVAEGVETQKQLQKVKQLRIPYIQGFLFFKPLPQSQIVGCLVNNNERAA